MSNVLIIRHLPSALSFQDKEQLLKHFGAEKVWETLSKRNYVFASFCNVDQARSALSRLHQLEIAQRRLVVEYSLEKDPQSCKNKNITADKLCSATTQNIQSFLKSLNSWNPSLDFYQPPPIHVKYKYPDISPKIIINLIHAMLKHKPLYIQNLHLMNKMSLDTPFQENEEAVHSFKDLFRPYFIEELSTIPLPEVVSEPESEISSDEDDKLHKPSLPAVVKRKHTLAKTRKRPAAVLSTANLPKVKRKATDSNDVFDKPQLQEQKKISLVVSQDALEKQTEPTAEVVGELGKFEIVKEPEQVLEAEDEVEKPTITKRELVQNRVSYSDMKLLPAFKNYHPGQKSMRLYIKNLAKNVTEQDVNRIYRRYVENLSESEQIGFDVRVMQEGRMKGQAFVTFPSEKIADQALNETNGFILNGKPMVVQFARAATANKKPIE